MLQWTFLNHMCLYTLLIISIEKTVKIVMYIYFCEWCLKKLFHCCSSTVVCIYPSTTLPPPQPSLPPSPASTPSWFCPCVLYSYSWNPFPPLSLPTSPLVTVKLYLISMSLVLFCLLFSFVDYVPVKGEIIWYSSLTAWLISLGIMLSSSICAVAKGRSSFFLSAA